MDELPPADVQPHVAETVEEDQIARLELILRDGSPDPVLSRGVVR